MTSSFGLWLESLLEAYTTYEIHMENPSLEKETPNKEPFPLETIDRPQRNFL